MQRKVPLPGKIFARCIPERRFAGLFGCMARTSCQSQPVFGCMARESCRELAIFPSEAAFGMHGAQNLPRIAARERTAAESCHGKTPGNAPRENIATTSRAKSASGRNPAAAGRWGRTARAFCHRRAPGNVSRHNLVTTGRPRRTLRAPMRHGSRSAHVRGSGCLPFVYATRHPDAAELRVLQAVRALAVAQPADCRVAAERVVNIAKLVSVPQRRSARHHAPQHHNAPRCNTMMPCVVRGAFVAAEKVSCGLRVSMR